MGKARPCCVREWVTGKRASQSLKFCFLKVSGMESERSERDGMRRHRVDTVLTMNTDPECVPTHKNHSTSSGSCQGQREHHKSARFSTSVLGSNSPGRNPSEEMHTCLEIPTNSLVFPSSMVSVNFAELAARQVLTRHALSCARPIDHSVSRESVGVESVCVSVTLQCIIGLSEGMRKACGLRMHIA